jgi:hypothetical protein
MTCWADDAETGRRLVAPAMPQISAVRSHRSEQTEVDPTPWRGDKRPSECTQQAESGEGIGQQCGRRDTATGAAMQGKEEERFGHHQGKNDVDDPTRGKELSHGHSGKRLVELNDRPIEN